jgi:hypothetical protein
VHKNVTTTVIRLDESVALLAIEPLHGSLRHIALLPGTYTRSGRASAAGFDSRFGESHQSIAPKGVGRIIRPKARFAQCGASRPGPQGPPQTRSAWDQRGRLVAKQRHLSIRPISVSALQGRVAVPYPEARDPQCGLERACGGRRDTSTNVSTNEEQNREMRRPAAAKGRLSF